MKDLEGRTVVITGASRGIGREIVVAVAEAGATVVGIARDGIALRKVVDGLPGPGHRAEVLDVADAEGWERLATSLGRVDGLVAAAAVMGPIGRVDTVDLSGVREAFETNVFGTLLAVRACLPGLQAAIGGSIVTFAGGGGGALPRYEAYAASKAAVVRLTENLAADLRDISVRVNAVAPGFVATDIHRATLEAGPEAAGHDYYQRTARGLADGGIPARAAADLTVFLLSNAASDMTGRTLSAQWDAWADDSWRKRVVEDRDMLTMRRIDGQLFCTATADSCPIALSPGSTKEST